MVAHVIGLPVDDWQAWRERKAEELKTAEEEAAAAREERESATEEEGR
jgi:hypothetical protein